MVDKSFTKVIKKLSTFQSNEKHARDNTNDSFRFVGEKGGQWEEHVYRLFDKKPRYEFDRVYPVVTAIHGDIQDTEFSARVVESGSGANKEVAKAYDGMLMSIQSMSNFNAIRAAAAKHLVIGGFDAWMVTNDWADVDAFEQDLLIKHINDAANRVWLGPTDEIDHSDCKEAFLLTAISVDEYERDYPEGSKQSVGSTEPICESDDEITIGDYYCIKEEEVLLHLLSNDKVVRDDQYQNVAESLAEQGVTIVRSRKRSLPKCYVRRFDGGDWLDKEKPTPFGYIPIVGVYAHYDVREGKRQYFGVTEKLKDAQRIYNYAKSREISEGALAPIEKIAMTERQAAGFEIQNSTLNTDTNPLLIYNKDPDAAPPYKIPGNQPNAGLAVTQQGAALDIQEISSSFNPARGQGLSNHSGVAYEILQSKSNLSAIDYINSIKLAVQLTAKILVDAIPKVYDTRGRQVRLMNEDGTSSYESINDEIMDENGKMVTMRDLSQGHYDVVVTVGKTFASRKTEGVEAMLSIAQAYPAIIEEGADVFVKSMDAPYVDQIGERIRARMLRDGMIPESQLTDEERAKIMQDMQREAEKGPDPMEQATLQAILAEVQRVQTESQRTMQDMQVQMMEQQRKNFEMMLKAAKNEADIQKSQAETVEKLTQSESDNEMPGNAGYIKASQVAREIK